MLHTGVNIIIYPEIIKTYEIQYHKITHKLLNLHLKIYWVFSCYRRYRKESKTTGVKTTVLHIWLHRCRRSYLSLCRWLVLHMSSVQSMTTGFFPLLFFLLDSTERNPMGLDMGLSCWNHVSSVEDNGDDDNDSSRCTSNQGILWTLCFLLSTMGIFNNSANLQNYFCFELAICLDASCKF